MDIARNVDLFVVIYASNERDIARAMFQRRNISLAAKKSAPFR